jgi:glycosyltransferase involved in cell wall biosynthesis
MNRDKRSNRISVIIITYNEEENIGACLETVEWADEIIVVDSFSTDKTLEICKRHAHEVIQRRWEGFGPQKQFALEQATCDWVLSIDADERVSPELREEILAGMNDFDREGYFVPRESFWLGKRLRFGGCGKERIVRFFKREKGRFQGNVHEKLIVQGEVGHLKHSILHVSYRDMDHYFQKFNLYSAMVARERFKSGTRVPFPLQVLFSMLDFLNRYILQLGFLDGMPGFLWASFSSFHRMVKYAKLWEIRQERKKLPGKIGR